MNAPDPFPVREALEFLRPRLPEAPDVFLVLGSGLGGLTGDVKGAVNIPFQQVPGLPRAGVAGHAGRLVAGTLEGRRVLVQAGRLHLYEGYSPGLVVAPVRLAKALGARTVVLTNAAGGIARDLLPGTIMLLRAHLNLQGRDPLAGWGKNRDGEISRKVREPLPWGTSEGILPNSTPYQEELLHLAAQVAAGLELPLPSGVYAGVLGPSYETPAEIRALAVLGADAVGMSTVPEATAASHLGLRVAAFSLITNRAPGLGGGPLSHQEVLEAGRRSGVGLSRLVRAFLRALPD